MSAIFGCSCLPGKTCPLGQAYHHKKDVDFQKKKKKKKDILAEEIVMMGFPFIPSGHKADSRSIHLENHRDESVTRLGWTDLVPIRLIRR